MVPGRAGLGTTEAIRRLVLASASPRRRELLGALGVEFEVVVPDIEELSEGEPAEVVLENARRKATAGLREVSARSRAGDESGLAVLGVDTDVALDGRLLGKPADAAGARSRLEALSGRTHEVLSGVVLVGGGTAPQPSHGGGDDNAAKPAEGAEGVARTEVTFRELTPELIGRYLASGEWEDRAGAYAIQGLGSILVEAMHGDFSNVVGLPLALLLDLAPELGKSL